jgi:hypothetical protein
LGNGGSGPVPKVRSRTAPTASRTAAAIPIESKTRRVISVFLFLNCFDLRAFAEAHHFSEHLAPSFRCSLFFQTTLAQVSILLTQTNSRNARKLAILLKNFPCEDPYDLYK